MRGVSIPKETLLFSAVRTFQSVHDESERSQIQQVAFHAVYRDAQTAGLLF